MSLEMSYSRLISWFSFQIHNLMGSNKTATFIHSRCSQEKTELCEYARPETGTPPQGPLILTGTKRTCTGGDATSPGTAARTLPAKPEGDGDPQGRILITRLRRQPKRDTGTTWTHEPQRAGTRDSDTRASSRALGPLGWTDLDTRRSVTLSCCQG